MYESFCFDVELGQRTSAGVGRIPSVYPKCNFFTAGSISLSPVYLWLSDLHRPVYVPLGHLLLFFRGDFSRYRGRVEAGPVATEV